MADYSQLLITYHSSLNARDRIHRATPPKTNQEVLAECLVDGRDGGCRRYGCG